MKYYIMVALLLLSGCTASGIAPSCECDCQETGSHFECSNDIKQINVRGK